MDLQIWRKLLSNQQIWEEGLMQVLFGSGETLKLLREYFFGLNKKAYFHAGQVLEEIIKKYYA